MRTPKSVHRRSDREYPETITDWKYPHDYKVTYITRNGAIRVNKKTSLFITTALMGKHVGLEELGSGIYRMYFREFLLGYIDMKTLHIYDIVTYTDPLDVQTMS